MKKVCARFRKWLIRKLGGVPRSDIPTLYVDTVSPVVVHAAVNRVDRTKYVDDPEYGVMIREQLERELIEQISDIEGGIQYNVHEDVVYYPNYSVRATMKIIPFPPEMQYHDFRDTSVEHLMTTVGRRPISMEGK